MRQDLQNNSVYKIEQKVTAKLIASIYNLQQYVLLGQRVIWIYVNKLGLNIDLKNKFVVVSKDSIFVDEELD